MQDYVEHIDEFSVEGAFGRAVLAVHSDSFVRAQQCVDRARELLDTELTALVAEGYGRAYRVVVQVSAYTDHSRRDM